MFIIHRGRQKYSTVVPEPGGPGRPLAPPIFGRSVNPIPIGEGSFVGTVELGDSELLDSEQTGNSEHFSMTNLPLYLFR